MCKTSSNILSFILAVALLSTTAYAQDKVGTTAAPFLGISVNPRATAMGAAFTAVSNDVSALYYNPGALPHAAKSQFTVAHTKWLVNTNLNWVGFLLNLDGTNTIGLSLTQLDYGQDQVTTVEFPEGTGETWDASDIALSFAYGRYLTDRFSIGGSVKYIQQKIWNESSTAFAFDVGLLFITQFNDMKLGMSISNFGTDMKMEGKDLLERVDLDPDAIGHNENIVSNLKTDAWPLPLFFRVGVSMDVIKNDVNRLTLAIDAMRPSDNSEIINVGGEWGFYDMIFFRSGYKSLFRDESEEGLTLGIGLGLPSMNRFGWSFDYTYADFGRFEDIHMFALSVMF
jgi:hypothetical protein